VFAPLALNVEFPPEQKDGVEELIVIEGLGDTVKTKVVIPMQPLVLVPVMV
jgi:hypothetical protein